MTAHTASTVSSPSMSRESSREPAPPPSHGLGEADIQARIDQAILMARADARKAILDELFNVHKTGGEKALLKRMEGMRKLYEAEFKEAKRLKKSGKAGSSTGIAPCKFKQEPCSAAVDPTTATAGSGGSTASSGGGQLKAQPTISKRAAKERTTTSASQRCAGHGTASIPTEKKTAIKQEPQSSTGSDSKGTGVKQEPDAPISKQAEKRRRAKAREREREKREFEKLLDQVERDLLGVKVDSNDDTKSSSSDPSSSITVRKVDPVHRDIIDKTVRDMLNFMWDDMGFDDSSGKLFVRQCLCLELGLAKLHPEDQEAAGFAPVTIIQDSDFCEDAPIRLFPIDNSLPDLPDTLTACDKLLKSKGHVNILDYCVARRERIKEVDDVLVDWMLQDMRSSVNNQGAFADLVQPTARGMIRSSKANKQIVNRDTVKENWFQPLLRTFH